MIANKMKRTSEDLQRLGEDTINNWENYDRREKIDRVARLFVYTCLINGYAAENQADFALATFAGGELQ